MVAEKVAVDNHRPPHARQNEGKHCVKPGKKVLTSITLEYFSAYLLFVHAKSEKVVADNHRPRPSQNEGTNYEEPGKKLQTFDTASLLVFLLFLHEKSELTAKCLKILIVITLFAILKVILIT